MTISDKDWRCITAYAFSKEAEKAGEIAAEEAVETRIEKLEQDLKDLPAPSTLSIDDAVLTLVALDVPQENARRYIADYYSGNLEDKFYEFSNKDATKALSGFFRDIVKKSPSMALNFTKGFFTFSSSVKTAWSEDGYEMAAKSSGITAGFLACLVYVPFQAGEMYASGDFDPVKALILTAIAAPNLASFGVETWRHFKKRLAYDKKEKLKEIGKASGIIKEEYDFYYPSPPPV